MQGVNIGPWRTSGTDSLNYATGGSTMSHMVDRHKYIFCQPRVPPRIHGCLDFEAVMEIHQPFINVLAEETIHCQFAQLQLLEQLELQSMLVHTKV